MTKEAIDLIIKHIHYKPDWGFVVKPVIPDTGTYYLQVRFPAYDATAEKYEVQSGRKWLLSEWMTEGEVVQTAFLAIKTAEEHELREQFSYYGVNIFGPHIEMDALISVAHKTKLREPTNENKTEKETA